MDIVIIGANYIGPTSAPFQIRWRKCWRPGLVDETITVSTLWNMVSLCFAENENVRDILIKAMTEVPQEDWENVKKEAVDLVESDRYRKLNFVPHAPVFYDFMTNIEMLRAFRHVD